VCARADVVEKWGFPPMSTAKIATRKRLCDVKEPWEDVRRLALCPLKHPVTWNSNRGRRFEEAELDAPIVVGTINGGGWGKNVYDGVHPATKASSHGVAGSTHLIADQDPDGNWFARTMSAQEVLTEFSAEGVKPCVDE